jgi:nucleoporin NUP42
MAKDFTRSVDKPLWPLSSYGPAKCEPTLVQNLDESPEELRLKAVTALRTGAMQDYVRLAFALLAFPPPDVCAPQQLKYESETISRAEQIYMDARNNITQAYEQATKHSVATALDMPQSSSATITSTAISPFAKTTTSFGQPSVFGAAGSIVSPVVLGGGSTSVFQPSTGSTTVFGSTAAPASSVFGKSVFGQPNFGQSTNTTAPSPFGQATSVFAQPQPLSSFGQVSQPQSSFIKPATGAFGSGAGGSAFGISPGQAPFGASTVGQQPFGNPVAASGTGNGGGFSAFAGQPTTFGLNATVGSVFGSAPSGNTWTSGAVTTQASTATTAFDTPSSFGVLTQSTGPTSAFGGSTFTLNQNAAESVFGSNGAAPAGAPTTSFSSQEQNQPQSSVPAAQEQPRKTSAFGFPSQQPASVFSSQTAAPLAPPKPATSLPNFSTGTQAYRPGLDKYDALLPDNYLQILPKTTREAFESKKFVWGKIPEWIPPKELR